jgi:hypothetical protein
VVEIIVYLRFTVPTWTKTVALVSEHTALAAVVAPSGDVPSVYAAGYPLRSMVGMALAKSIYAQPSGAARPASASPPPSGSRLPGCTR